MPGTVSEAPVGPPACMTGHRRRAKWSDLQLLRCSGRFLRNWQRFLAPMRRHPLALVQKSDQLARQRALYAGARELVMG